MPWRRASLRQAATACISASCFCLIATTAGALSPVTDDERAATLYATAQELIAQGRQPQALSKFEAITKHYRKGALAADAQYRIGSLYLANRELQDAFDAFQAVIEKYTASSLYLDAMEGEFAAARLAVAGYAEAQRRGQKPGGDFPPKDMVVDMFRIIVKNGRYTDFAPRAQYSLATALHQLGLPEEAIIEHERLMREYPDSKLADDSAYQIANINFKEVPRRNYEQRTLQRALVAFGDFELAYPSSEHLPEARHRIKTLQAWQKTYLLQTADQYEHRGDLKAAVIYLNEALKQFPDAPDNASIAGRIEFLQSKIKSNSPL